MARADRKHLVIGYGNELRGDDGAGCRIGRAVEDWAHPGTQVLVTHQLTPELAAALAKVRIATFIDVYPADRPQAPVNLYRIAPPDGSSSEHPGPHACQPEDLLNLTEQVYGNRPVGWVLAVPAHDFSIGEGLTPPTTRAMQDALMLLRIHLDTMALADDKELQ